jgi:hypothetical protein
LNPEKCQLFQKEVRYIAHIVSPSKVTTNTDKLEAVKSWLRTNDKRHLRSILGLYTYYRIFISGFADIARPLTRLTEEKGKFEWSTETETAFQTIKVTLCSARVLGYTRTGEKFIIDTDASNVGIGVSCPKCKMVAKGLQRTSAKRPMSRPLRPSPDHFAALL